jgi:dTDP-4-amino-4,6-dideoxygalactose transaminase
MTIRFNEPYIAGHELDYLGEVITSGSFAGNGPFTKKVHALLEGRYDVPNVLLTHSCTGALELAALTLGIGAGDAVVVPSYTFASTASAFMRTGARIIFCDIDPETMNLDIEDALARVTPETKAVVPVHYGGIGVDIPRLQLELADYDAVLVEDAAQGLEARFGESWLGTLAPLGAFSFHETKNIHSGLGGALFVNDRSLFERAEDIWERGTNRTKMLRGLVDKYTWVELGSSFYPSELQAAFLLAQLETLERNLSERRSIYEAYQVRMQPMEEKGWLRLPHIGQKHHLNYHSFFAIFESVRDSDAIREVLLASDIHAYIGYVPLHSSPMGRRLGYRPGDLPRTREYAPRVLRMPFHNQLSVDDVDRVCSCIESYFRGGGK